MGKLDIAIVIIVGVGGLSCLRAGFTRSVWELLRCLLVHSSLAKSGKM